ncbi:MAG: hypothetical protein JW891_01430 [Candidatus Lokiarchaeota archaeon]|nr:hypothetical protein [Candidatus Lokiarchaeota archaeon]
MKLKTLKLIATILLVILVLNAINGFLIINNDPNLKELRTSADDDGDGFENEVEINLGTDPLNQWSYPKPELNFSHINFSNNLLSIKIINQGTWRAQNIIVLIEIPSLILILYNNSDHPHNLDVDEEFQVNVDLIDYDFYLLPGINYNINIDIDPDNTINETIEDNNLIILTDIRYNFIQNQPANYSIIIIISIIIAFATSLSIGMVYAIKKKKKARTLLNYQLGDNRNLESPFQGINFQNADLNEKKHKSSADNNTNITDFDLTREQNFINNTEQETEETEKEISVEKPQFVCVVHRGEIFGSVYICPNCQTIYCEKCVSTLKVKGEKCWSCKKDFQ